jgi:YD repeat-containing protein
VNGSEHPTEIRYPSLTRTVVMHGAAATLGSIPYDHLTPCAEAGDFTCSEYLYDGLARLAKTLKRRHDNSLAAEHRCYTPIGRPSQQSEWISGAAAFSCDDEAGAARTRTYYTGTSDGRSDPLGRPRRVVTADNFLTEYDYGGQTTTIRVHGLNRAADPAGVATTVQVRDAFDRLIRVDSDGGADAVYTYDTEDRLVEVALGVLDSSGNMGASPAVQRRHFVYDTLGRLTEEAHPENGRTRYLAFDPLGNVLQRVDSRGIAIRTTFDAAGRLLSEELSVDQEWRPLTRNVYDAGRLNGATSLPLGKLTRIESYDDNGTLVSQRDLGYSGLNGRLGRDEVQVLGMTAWFTTTYHHNGFGLLEQLGYPGEPTWSQPLLATFQYGNGYLSRAETRNAPRNLIATAMAYNMAGSLLLWEGGNATRTTIEPDIRNRPGRIYVDRLADEQAPSLFEAQGTNSPLLQAAGKPSKPAPEGGLTQCTDGIDNDSDGLIDCADSGCATYCVPENTYDTCTNRVDDNLNGLTDCQDPSCQGLFCPAQQVPESDAGVCSDFWDNDWDGLIDCADPDCTTSAPAACRYWDSGDYEYDGAGNITATVKGVSERDSYSYDKLNRLTSATLSSAGGGSVDFDYDEFGSMRLWQKRAGTTVYARRAFELDPVTNRILSGALNYSTSTPFRYNAAGSLTADDRQRYEYDSRGRLVRVRDAYGSLVSEYVYDATGNRIRMLGDQRLTYYLRDFEGRVLTEFATPSSIFDPPYWTKAYLHAGQQQVGFLNPSSTEIPQPPDKVAGRISSIGIRLYWKPVPNAKYVVYRRTGTSPMTARFVTPIKDNWYQDVGGLQNGKTYEYSVESIDRFGARSSLSQPFSITKVSSSGVAVAWADPWVVANPESLTIRWSTTETNGYVIGFGIERNGTQLNEYVSCGLLDPSGVSIRCYFPVPPSEFTDSSGPGGEYRVCSLGTDGKLDV